MRRHKLQLPVDRFWAGSGRHPWRSLQWAWSLLPPSNWPTFRILTELHVEMRAVSILSADRSLLVSCLCEMAGRWADSLCVSPYVQMMKLPLGSRRLYFVLVTDGH